MKLSDMFKGRDAAFLFLGEMHYEHHLNAINRLLSVNKAEQNKLSAEMEEVDRFARSSSGTANERAVEDWGELFYIDVFQDAAHSLAAVGVIAPFIESLFTRAFLEVGNQYGAVIEQRSPHRRWSLPDPIKWDCSFASTETQKKDRNVVEGILQLNQLSGLSAYLSKAPDMVLKALFLYRNKMFHCGFEWMPQDLAKFENEFDGLGAPRTWFSKATTGDRTWVIYLTDEFLAECQSLCDDLLRGIGSLALQLRESPTPLQS